MGARPARGGRSNRQGRPPQRVPQAGDPLRYHGRPLRLPGPPRVRLRRPLGRALPRRARLARERRPAREGRADILRVVQAGLGTWGRSWAGVVAGASGIDLAAVVDPDPEARGHVDATPGYGVLEEALAAVGCDAVLVASPPGTHHAVAKAALGAGKHVLCEKPLATSL